MKGEELLRLTECKLFSGMKKDEIEKLIKGKGYRIKKFMKDSVIMFQGDAYTDLLVVLNGTVSAEISDSFGKRVKLEIFKRSSIIAPGILFAIDNTLPVTIIAETDCSLLSISKETVISNLQTNRSYLINYLTTTGNKINILAEKIRMFKFSSIQQKIAGYLLNLHEKQGSNILDIPYTRENLADFFGVARPSLSRELSRMSEAGIIAIDGKKIKLLKKTALKYLLEGKILE